MATAAPPLPHLAIRVLGPLEVTIDGAPLVVDTRKALAILALLAVERRPFARDELAALLWPDADDESARGALRRTLSVLRAGLAGDWLRVDRATVRLDDAAAVDLVAFERAAARGTPEGLREAADLARGPFLAGFSLRDSPDWDDWRAARESALDRQVGEVLERLTDALDASGDPAGAAAVAARRVARDPLDEAAHRRLMLSLARAGDRAGAIRQYRACVAVLERELGVAPLEETTALYEAIRDGRIEVAAASSSARPVAPVASGASAPAPDSATARATPIDRPDRAASPLIGRASELASILEAHRSSAPDGRLALVEGEAGIGKTRLLDEVIEAVAAAGGPVLQTCAYAAEVGIPYGVVIDLLRAARARPGPAARIDALPEVIRAELSRLVDIGPAPAPPPADGPGARARLLGAIGEALAAAVGDVRRAPGLIVVDDVHAADEASREALAYLARRLQGRPLLLVLAWRREDLGPAGLALSAALAAEATTHITLGRLDDDEALQLLRSLRDGVPDDDGPDLRDLTARAEGLPLYLVEVLTTPAAATPVGMTALLRDRLASVGETAAQVVAAAAVIGRSFDPGTLRSASGRTEDEVVDALDELLGRGLVREVGLGPDGDVRYDFAHGLVRDVAYGSTSLARRRLLHRRVADALRSAGRGRDEAGSLARLAAHEQAAGRDAEAAEAYREAGIRAAEVLATSEAVSHLETALALGHPDRADLHRRIGELRTRLGDYPGALRALEAGAAIADGPALVALERALAAVQLRRGDAAAADGHLAAALAALDPDDDRDRARLLAERAIAAIRRADPAAASGYADEAVTRAVAVGDRATIVLAYRVAGLAARAAGDLGAAAGQLEASLALALDTPPDVAARVAARNAIALVAIPAGRIAEAVAAAQAALADVRSIGDRHLEAVVENTLADALHAAGDRDASLDHLKRAVALFAEVGGSPADPEPGIWALETW